MSKRQDISDLKLQVKCLTNELKRTDKNLKMTQDHVSKLMAASMDETPVDWSMGLFHGRPYTVTSKSMSMKYTAIDAIGLILAHLKLKIDNTVGVESKLVLESTVEKRPAKKRAKKAKKK